MCGAYRVETAQERSLTEVVLIVGIAAQGWSNGLPQFHLLFSMFGHEIQMVVDLPASGCNETASSWRPHIVITGPWPIAAQSSACTLQPTCPCSASPSCQLFSSVSSLTTLLLWSLPFCASGFLGHREPHTTLCDEGRLGGDGKEAPLRPVYHLVP